MAENFMVLIVGFISRVITWKGCMFADKLIIVTHKLNNYTAFSKQIDKTVWPVLYSI